MSQVKAVTQSGVSVVLQRVGLHSSLLRKNFLYRTLFSDI